ncbi:stAR-related lipid transfer protein 7, mitochondrial-like isoform X1 [Tripterygium wilfordii]|uniref:stAR-related lipid transfer protein 7, mitochondrial-like isoform X1 n=1 Tax=Tripterygium wilfordii TaxID=458696 RepID=UPI0018F83474|nr:stAR-related lipid transfer protein 7, mitochondrial-like isoform X1 [Tripterygium wilfordii]
MDGGLFDLMEFLRRPSITETFVDILLCAVPIWLAVMIGLVIGWSWRPRWTGFVFLGMRSKLRFVWTVPPGFGARRLWLAFTALSVFSACRTIWSNLKLKGEKSASREIDAASPSTRQVVEERGIATENDLEHLLYFLEGNIEWQSMMERSTPNMSYQAWIHEPETGPVVYRTRTVFEDATPELVRDFFWDDEFRTKWDPMLTSIKILEIYPDIGAMVVQWIKKFPFFCSDREYIFGRKIWEAGKTYYCVTKGVPYSGLEKRDKPRRVELYFSSWVIRAVESRKGDGQMSACEVTLIHYEDMGIPKDVAKLGVRHGMWGTVKKLHSGLRAYQNARKSDAPLSKSAFMAQMTTKLASDGSMGSSGPVSSEEEKRRAVETRKQEGHVIDWKWVVIGGVALVCGLQSGVVGKALMMGAGQRIARR